MMAPARTKGLAPSKQPAGYRMEIPAMVVPKPVPAAVANAAQEMNATRTNSIP